MRKFSTNIKVKYEGVITVAILTGSLVMGCSACKVAECRGTKKAIRIYRENV